MAGREHNREAAALGLHFLLKFGGPLYVFFFASCRKIKKLTCEVFNYLTIMDGSFLIAYIFL